LGNCTTRSWRRTTKRVAVEAEKQREKGTKKKKKKKQNKKLLVTQKRNIMRRRTFLFIIIRKGNERNARKKGKKIHTYTLPLLETSHHPPFNQKLSFYVS
jgi:hypothetical protein